LKDEGSGSFFEKKEPKKLLTVAGVGEVDGGWGEAGGLWIERRGWVISTEEQTFFAELFSKKRPLT